MTATAPKYSTSHRLGLVECLGCGSLISDEAAHTKHHATLSGYGTAITALKSAVTTIKKAIAAKKKAASRA